MFVYALLGYAVETTDPAAVARFGRAQACRRPGGGGDGVRRARRCSRSDAELLARLAGRRARRSRPTTHYLDDLVRRGAHTRSGGGRGGAGARLRRFSGPFTVYSALVDSDVVFAPAVRPWPAASRSRSRRGRSTRCSRAPTATLRRSAWESYADGYLGVRNALAANLASTVKQAVFSARVRRYESSLAASLSRSNVPPEVFDNLIATFEANLPTWHRYWRLRRSDPRRREACALRSSRRRSGHPRPCSTYEQCVEWICDSLAPLGDAYVETVRRGCLEERWVDVYPTAGKMGGAFSAGAPGTSPFIVMSFDGTAVSLGTLAHELGHSMHSYLAWQSQPQVYTRYSMFVAEVASNFHQVLLRAHLLETVDDPAVQLAVLEEAMANFHRYFFIMPTLARFEREMHERVARGEGLTAELLCDRMADLFAEGFGPDVELDRERVGITWAQFGHLYEPFYVYQYATGISGAHALARGVLDGEAGAAERYLAFLSAGDSVYPLDALRNAGVDLGSPEPVESTFAVLASLVDRIEQLV